MRNLYTFQRININRKEDVQVYNSQWLRKIGKLRARRNTRIDVKNKGTKGEEKEGEACSTLGNYETRDCCVAREGARRMGLVEGDPFPIRVSPQAFNHPIKRIFTYVN